MKIEPHRLFAYSVLAEGRNDYKACRFFAESKYQLYADAANNLVFDLKLSTDCAEINRLIAGGDFVCKVPLSLMKDKIFRAAFIVLRRSVKNFSCNNWNAYFFKNVGSTFIIYRRLDDDSAVDFIDGTAKTRPCSCS